MITYEKQVKRCQAETVTRFQCRKEAERGVYCGQHYGMGDRVRKFQNPAEFMTTYVSDYTVESTPLSEMEPLPEPLVIALPADNWLRALVEQE